MFNTDSHLLCSCLQFLINSLQSVDHAIESIKEYILDFLLIFNLLKSSVSFSPHYIYECNHNIPAEQEICCTETANNFTIFMSNVCDLHPFSSRVALNCNYLAYIRCQTKMYNLTFNSLGLSTRVLKWWLYQCNSCPFIQHGVTRCV